MNETTVALLTSALAVVVPLRIDVFTHWPLDRVLLRVRGHVDTIAFKGEAILYRHPEDEHDGRG